MRFLSFLDMITLRAVIAPESVALRSGDRSVTYPELASRIRSCRPAEGKCVGFLLGEVTDETIVRLFAAVEAGKQIVLLDESLSDGALRELIRYADIDSLEGDPELCAELADALCEPCAENGAGKLLFFTSGTTERSKAVVLTEKSLCASAYNGAALLPLKPEDTLLSVLPLNHVFGFVCSLLWGFQCGATVALGRGARHIPDDMDYYRPTAISVVPMLLGFFIKNNLMNDELELILIGAGDCSPDLILVARALGKRVSFGYGLTETSSGVALSLGDDAGAMTVCPDDKITIAEDGEILISAPTSMMQGYYKRESPNLVNGVLHTGDLGIVDREGHLRVTGRKKEVLVLRDGTKIFLPEYEADLAAALGERDMAVTVRNGAPVLVIVAGEDERQEITERLKPVMRNLPRGQQLAGIELRAAPLPRTATGKIKRWTLTSR